MSKPRYMEGLLKIVFLWLGIAFIIMGIVEKVYWQKYTQYGGESPYRILYTYTWQGKTYHRKSYLLWDRPDFTVHDSIVVYVNNLGQSTVQP